MNFAVRSTCVQDTEYGIRGRGGERGKRVRISRERDLSSAPAPTGRGISGNSVELEVPRAAEEQSSKGSPAGRVCGRVTRWSSGRL